MRLGVRQGGGKSKAGKSALAIALSAAVALTTLGLSGCGSFFSSSPSATHLAYIAGGVNSLSAYRLDDKTGVASLLVGSPYLAGNSPSSVVVHPSGKFLLVANAADSTISLFTINASSGALTEVLPRTTTGLAPDFMALDSGGTYLFVADQVANKVESFQVSSTGGLTPVSSVSVGASPGGLALTSSGLLFVPLPNFSDIAVLSENAGVLQLVGLYPATNGVAGVAVDPGTKFLYATNPSTSTVSVFSIQAGGALSALPGLTSGAGSIPAAAAVDATGKFFYVANTGSGTVSQFTIDSTTGALTAFTTAAVSAGTNPSFVVEDPDGKFLFVGNVGSSSVTELTIGTDGSLTNSNTISLSFVPRSLAAAK